MTARDKDARSAMDTILYSVLTGDTDPMTPADVAHDAWGYADAMEAERAKRVPLEVEAPESPAFKRGQRVEYIGPMSSMICPRANVGTVDAVHGDRYGIRWDGGGYSTEGAADIRAAQATAPEIREPLPGDEHVGAGASPSRSMRRDAEPQLTAAQVMELGRRVGQEEMDAACEKARREGRDAGLREGNGQCERGLPVYSALATDRLKALATENAKLHAVAEAAARLQLWREDDRGSDDAGEVASRALADALDVALPGWRTK